MGLGLVSDGNGGFTVGLWLGLVQAGLSVDLDLGLDSSRLFRVG